MLVCAGEYGDRRYVARFVRRSGNEIRQTVSCALKELDSESLGRIGSRGCIRERASAKAKRRRSDNPRQVGIREQTSVGSVDKTHAKYSRLCELVEHFRLPSRFTPRCEVAARLKPANSSLHLTRRR